MNQQIILIYFCETKNILIIKLIVASLIANKINDAHATEIDMYTNGLFI